MNVLQRSLFKLRDPVGYKHWKFLHKLSSVSQPEVDLAPRAEWHFKHSGNAGDIIYTIPSMLALAKGAPIHLHLAIDQPIKMAKGTYHPLGGVMLNSRMVELLKPLLLAHPQIRSCNVWDGRAVDVDFDIFRQYPLLFDRGNIARWSMLIWGLNWDLTQPWLFAEPDESVKDAIVIARSHRYQMPGIDYSFLNAYPELLFVGLPEEFEAMKQVLPGLRHRPTGNFLELAQVIAGSRLFIGNQSFPFSVAEGLKTLRLLENYYRIPNVIVYGDKGFDFSFQKPFEKLVRDLYNRQS
jgi:hypothetical protein